MKCGGEVVGTTYQSVFMAGSVDGGDFFESEVPFQIRDYEGRYETTTRSINMDDSIKILGDQKIIDGLGIFILASVGAPKDDTDANLKTSAVAHNLLLAM
jgi:hypothetical protein